MPSSDIDLDWEEWKPEELSFVHHMIAGSCAGLAEHVSVFPMDTLKTHIQCEKCGSTNLFQTWSCASKIVRQEGIFRLWRGVSAMFAGCIPAHAAYFSTYESIKSLSSESGHNPWIDALAGGSAAFAHDIFMNPFDLVKQRMQLGYYKNIYQCIRQIAFSEGVSGFYVSLPTTVLMNIPHGMIQVATNETCRKLIDPSGKYSIKTHLMSGCIAGGVAAFLTNPLDVIKTRLQTANYKESCPRTRTVFSTHRLVYASNSLVTLRGVDIAVNLVRYEGFQAFFRGSFARVMVQAPGVAVSWAAYEHVKLLLTYHKSIRR